jgi:predicted component of type VI protein secretion system
LDLKALNKLTEVALTVEQMADFEPVLIDMLSEGDNS